MEWMNTIMKSDWLSIYLVFYEDLYLQNVSLIRESKWGEWRKNSKKVVVSINQKNTLISKKKRKLTWM